MATFEGTEAEFTRFIGPRVRNVVNTMTRSAKIRTGYTCAHCGRKGVELEAAHVYGRDRKTVVHEVLEKYRIEGGYRVDLDPFERELKEAHEPIEKSFLFLCSDCHRAYDREGRAPTEDGRPARPTAGVLEPSSNPVPEGLGLAPGETNKSYVNRVFRALYGAGRISDTELFRLMSDDVESAEYRHRTFGFSRPLLVSSPEMRFDLTNHPRYYAEPVCDGLYLCKEWVSKPGSPSYNLDKFQAWARRMLSFLGEVAPARC